MSYVISCLINCVPHGIRANEASCKFELMPMDNEISLGKILSHPHRNAIKDILDWIKENDKELASHDLKIHDEQLYRK